MVLGLGDSDAAFPAGGSVALAVLVGAVGVVGYALGRRSADADAFASAGSRRLSRGSKNRKSSDVDDDVEDSDEVSVGDGSDDAAYECADEPHKMVMVVRMDLKMGKGKVAAQCCHAAVACYRRASAPALRAWYGHGQAKVAVKCKTEADLREIAARAKSLGLVHYVVCDAGRTQIAAGSYTVCGIGPAPVSKIDQVTGGLKLL